MYFLAKLLNHLFNFTSVDQYYDGGLKKVITRWTITLPGSGCSWSKQSDGGCYMCGFSNQTRKYTLGHILPRVIHMVLLRAGNMLSSPSSPEMVSIYVGGNFLNNREINHKTQISIIRFLASKKHIKRVLIESRPEFITNAKLAEITNILGDKTLQIGIGLECQSDEIRNNNLHKGFLKKHYEKALELMSSYNVRTLTYVFVKPLNLSERSSLDEAVKTIRYAAKFNSNDIVIEAALIQQKTFMYEKYIGGLYRPPWLWTLIQIAVETNDIKRIRFGAFSDWPKPIAIPYNCEKCSKKIYGLFEKYRLSNDINLFANLDCSCKSEWKKELYA